MIGKIPDVEWMSSVGIDPLPCRSERTLSCDRLLKKIAITANFLNVQAIFKLTFFVA